MQYIHSAIAHPWKVLVGTVVWLIVLSGVSVGLLAQLGMSESMLHYLVWLSLFLIPACIVGVLALVLLYRALFKAGSWGTALSYLVCAVIIDLFFCIAFLFVTFAVFGFS
jgi:hypothetical protein